MTAPAEASADRRGAPVWPGRARGLGTALLAVTMMLGGSGVASGQAEGVRLHAAGSLRAALTEVARAFTTAFGVPVELQFGASGLLRERLERGEPGDVFASANMEHPRTLARSGRAGPVVLFTRNQLCALARAEVGLTTDTLLDRLLDPAVTLGTSTPGADPSGDYAWEVFRRDSVMEVNSANGPRVNAAAGKAFADFMLSPAVQATIRTFGVDKYGQPLFVPIAGQREEEVGR